MADEISSRTQALIDDTPLVTLERAQWTASRGIQIPAIPGMGPYARAQMVVIQQMNVLAGRLANEPAIRSASADLTDELTLIPAQAPATIARFCRERIRYRQESPLEETVAGPFHVLQTRVGDCDDKATLFACLMLSLGLWGFAAGVYSQDVRAFVHAVGVCPGPNGAWMVCEVSDDTNYGAPPSPMLQATHRDREALFFWHPARQAWFVSGRS